jgi:hypothetical protein
VDLRRLRVQEWIVGACGAALIASTFVDWYRIGPVTRDAWQAYAVLDVILALVGAAAVALAVVTAVHRSQAVPTAIGSLLVPIGIVVSAWLVYRAASPPEWTVQLGPRATGYRPGTDLEAGVWIALAACLGATVATIASIRDDRFPRAVADSARVDIPTLPAPPAEGAGGASG